MNTGKIKIIALLILVVAVIVAVLNIGEAQEVSADRPAVITLDFYEGWLEARQSSTTDPYGEDLHNTPILGKEVKKELKDGMDNEIDPVLCQSTVPSGLSARVVYQEAEEAQIIVLAQDDGIYEQSIATLTKLNEGWYISDIECSAGEFAPEKEFNFEHVGFLHTEVPEPWTSGSWHIIFVENELLGIVPLIFDQNSMCVDSDGGESVCDTNNLVAETKVTIFGNLTEYGASVKRLVFEN